MNFELSFEGIRFSWESKQKKKRGLKAWEKPEANVQRKRSIFIPTPKKNNAKECSNYCTIAFISCASKIILRILQARLQQYETNIYVQTGFRKGKTREQIANFHWITEKVREFQGEKKSTSVSLTTLMPLTVWITTNCEVFLKKWGYQTTLPVSWETCMRVKKHQLEPYMEQQTGSKLEKKYNKAVYHHPAYLTSMQSTSKQNARLDESWARIKIAGTISTTSDMQMIPL